MNIARELAHVDELTLEALPREERERYERYADAIAPLFDEDELHEGCHSPEALEDARKDGHATGYREACGRFLEGVEKMKAAAGERRWNLDTLDAVYRRVLAVQAELDDPKAAAA